MLKPRIIPCLLVRNGGLVKTRRFSDGKYVGDPLNAVRIFNEKTVDELIVLDIDATVRAREPDYALVERLAVECRMPLCYGGGIQSPEHAQRIIQLGVEKVAVSSAALARPGLIAEMAARVGSQSVVVVMDVRLAKRGRYEVFTHNGTRSTGKDPAEVAQAAAANGCGEIVVNSIDRDGEMTGYDMDLATRVREATTVPLTILGGAGSLDHVRDLISRFQIIGAAAGSLFVFKGQYRAVLINYPNRAEKQLVLDAALQATSQNA